MNKVKWTPGKKQAIISQVRKAIKSGKTLQTAIKEAGIWPSMYYSWLRMQPKRRMYAA